MNQLIGTQSYCIYRGQKYIEKSFGKDRTSSVWYVTVPKPANFVKADFPDALEFGGSGDDAWVKLPVKALSRRWSEHVFGIWRGVQVSVRVVPWRGKLVPYCYTNDPAAGKRGLSGNQYDGWQGSVSPDEVQLTYTEVREYPIDPPGGVLRSQDVKVTKIPFDSVNDTKYQEE